MKAAKVVFGKQYERRIIWAALRASLETSKYKYKRSGKKSRSHWTTFERLLRVFKWFLKLGGLYRQGMMNARNVQSEKITLAFDNLPDAFDGFTILHLSDLHIDSLRGHEDNILKAIGNQHYDTVFFNGDYRRDTSGSFRGIIKPMKRIAEALNPPFGKWAVLGNHDTYLMAEYEEEVGISLLINETAEFEKEGEKIYLTGTDDPFYYFSEQAILALEQPIKGFKIAMVHTSELRDFAADNNYCLYLSGHTHGGQICLPNKKALISHQFEGNEYTAGAWKYKNMTGYTSRGCGVSGLPVRFNCLPEITFITLKKS
ncbi:MAG TPA: metallophosphoesterase [Bacteroidales bacterium]|nr:metallophosphoesterase [Bacteroidales bacterium]